MKRLANMLIGVLRRRGGPRRNDAATAARGDAIAPPSERAACWHLD